MAITVHVDNLTMNNKVYNSGDVESNPTAEMIRKARANYEINGVVALTETAPTTGHDAILEADRAAKLGLTVDEVDELLAEAIPDGAVTNAKLADDAKVGSLAALTTTDKTSVVGAVNEVKEAADAAQDAADAAQADADAAVAAVSGKLTASGSAFKGIVTLAGANPTPVAFGAATAATLTGTEAEPFDLSTDGLTLIVTVDGVEDTATFNCTAGEHESGLNPSTDISAGVDAKFKIQVDDDAAGAQTVSLTTAGKNTGALIAAEMETKIQALGGVYASVTVAYSGEAPNDSYTITSGTKGTGSKVRITRADDHNITEELKLGPDGGTDTDGTGDFVNAAAATAAEVITVIEADIAGLTATASNGAIKLTSDTTGSSSTLVIGAGTANAALGFTESASNRGAAGLNIGTRASANYAVWPVVIETNTPAAKAVAAKDRTVNGFNLYCETAAATDSVAILLWE